MGSEVGRIREDRWSKPNPCVVNMESVGVLMTCPMHSYIQEELAKRFNLFKLWDFPSFPAFAQLHGNSVRAVVANVKVGVDAAAIDSLPNLEIVSTYSVGYDNIDLPKCTEKGIPVTNTPNVLTDDVADLAIALALSLLCRISHSPRRNSAAHFTPKVFTYSFYQ